MAPEEVEGDFIEVVGKVGSVEEGKGKVLKGHMTLNNRKIMI